MQSFRQLWMTTLSTVSLLTVGLLGEVVVPRPALSAEEIRLVVTGPIAVSISVDALETFAGTGDIPPNLQPYARFLDDGNRQRLRQGLTRPVPWDVSAVGHMTYSPLGRDFLFNLGKVLRVHPEINGLQGLRAALINAAAANPDGWTAIDVLRQFPTDVVHLDLRDFWR